MNNNASNVPVCATIVATGGFLFGLVVLLFVLKENKNVSIEWIQNALRSK